MIHRKPHVVVVHPEQLMGEGDGTHGPARDDRVIDWLADHILASRLMFYAAFILPLCALPAPFCGKNLPAKILDSAWRQVDVFVSEHFRYSTVMRFANRGE